MHVFGRVLAELLLVEIGQVGLIVEEMRLVHADHSEELFKFQVKFVANHRVLLEVLNIVKVEINAGLDTELEHGRKHHKFLSQITISFGHMACQLLDVLEISQVSLRLEAAEETLRDCLFTLHDFTRRSRQLHVEVDAVLDLCEGLDCFIP